MSGYQPEPTKEAQAIGATAAGPALPRESGRSSAREKLSRLDRKLLLKCGLVIIALLVAYFVYQDFMYVSTDNAYVQGESTLISARVGGIIVKSDVEENQKVKAGQTLVEISPGDYENAANQSKANMDALEAQVQGAKINFDRTSSLYRHGAATKERLDSAEAQYKSLLSQWNASQAAYAQAQLNLSYTKVTAPTDGKVSRKSFEVGMIANPGQPLLGFVEGNERWVDANFKETDLPGISVGKKAYVWVDAIPGKTIRGVVESISPATGATFSLLPPDNATGNFTKVVQRVPVRIKLLDLTEQDIDRLAAGLSAEVKIQVH